MTAFSMVAMLRVRRQSRTLAGNLVVTGIMP
jgi:hypothetical protein